MQRPALLVPIVAVIAVAAVVAVALAGNSNNNSSNTTMTGGASPYGGSMPAAAPAKPPAAKGRARVATADHGLGAMLVDAQGRTLYLWKGDPGKASMCSGECARDWPPVTTAGQPAAGRGVKAGLFGTTKRPGGGTQVTYAGHPLYRYAGDIKAGQATGQGSPAFGAVWWVVAPGGAAITRSAH